jgi:hypothetical protein
MGGGGKKEKQPAPVTAPTIDPWGYQGAGGYQQFQNQGYQPTPQTFTQTGRPSWMQGHFAMPEWGMRADDPTQQVTPDMLDPRTAMFAQRDAYNAIGNGLQPAQLPQQGYAIDPRQAPDGSVASALARYAGQSSALQGPRGQQMGVQTPFAGGGKGMQAGQPLDPKMASLLSQVQSGPQSYPSYPDAQSAVAAGAIPAGILQGMQFVPKSGT